MMLGGFSAGDSWSPRDVDCLRQLLVRVLIVCEPKQHKLMVSV